MYKFNCEGYIDNIGSSFSKHLCCSNNKNRSDAFPSRKDTVSHRLMQPLWKFIFFRQKGVKRLIYNTFSFLQIFLQVQNYSPSGSNGLVSSSPFLFCISISTFFSALSSILLQTRESFTPSSKIFKDFSKESSPFSRVSTISSSLFNASSNLISAIDLTEYLSFRKNYIYIIARLHIF